jgi:chemotaxis protein histidine kinase CheA
MPPKGYRHISVKESIYNKLLEFARSKGLSSINDAIALLLEYSDVLSRIEAFLSSRALQPSPAPSPQAPQAPREEGVEVVKPEEKRAEVKPLEKPEKPEERKVERKKALKPKFFEEEPEKPAESKPKPRFFEEPPYKTLTKSWIMENTRAHDVEKFVEEWRRRGWKDIIMEDYVTLLDPLREDEALDEVLGIVNKMSEKDVSGRDRVRQTMMELRRKKDDRWRALGALLAFNKLGLVYYDGKSWRRASEERATSIMTSAAETKAEAKGTTETETTETTETKEEAGMIEKTADEAMALIWRFKKLEEELKGRLFKSFSKEEMKERGYEKVEDLKSDLAGIGWTTYDLSKLEWKNFYEYAGDLLKSGVGDYIVALSMEDRKKVAKTIASHLNERGVKGIGPLIAQSLESLKEGGDERDLFLSALVLKENGEIYFSNSGKWEVA